MTYDRFEVVRVPFPFTDRLASKHRPALVLSDPTAFDKDVGQSVMAMITSATHSAWPLDHAISDLAAAGLPRPCVVRFKLFTLDHRVVLGTIGRLGAADQRGVIDKVERLLALTTRPAAGKE